VNRRIFMTLCAAPGLAACESVKSITAPTATSGSLPSGVVASDTALLSAISGSSPIKIWSSLHQDYLVTGFQGTTYPNLVFLINGLRFEDLGVSNKQLSKDDAWSCKQI